MKFSKALTLLAAIILMSPSNLLARQTPDTVHTVEDLRAQLRDVQNQETEWQLRVQQLDEDLKPENIRNYFLGVGTTRPEELREQRRRQLQLEKDRALAQLDQLATSRLRLESSISAAEAAMYQQGSAALQVNRPPGAQFYVLRILVMVFILVVAVLSFALIVLLRRRHRTD